ncbi:MAG: hypothetical protein R3Y68_01235 [Rikenellaceae bacterium]
MKRVLLSLLSLAVFAPAVVSAKVKDLNYDIYGFARTDFYFDDRATAAAVNDIFYLYPLDVSLDAVGEDLNAYPSSGLFAFITRLGIDISGGKVGSADATVKVEVDFGGYGDYNTLLRIRQAYLNLTWEGGSSLTAGQTWHPMFGAVLPYVTNVSTGAPFQPFNRSPQLRYEYRTGGVKFIAAALCQLQYATSGVSGSTNQYMRNACVPEFYGGFDYSSNGWLIGGGVDISTIAPRTQSTYNGATYSVRERLTSTSAEAHVSYRADKLYVGAKSIYGAAVEHLTMLSGYGVSSVDATTGEQEYTALRGSTSWVNVVYGKRLRPSLFVGYIKNLGSAESLVSSSSVYGRGLNIDQMCCAGLGATYNLPSFTFGVEYSNTTAWYGSIEAASGRVVDTHSVANNRFVASVAYFF